MKRLCCVALSAVVMTSCAEMFPGQVSSGIARLTIRNVGAMVQLVSEDTSCGFLTPSVDQNPVLEGAIGEIGTAVWRVESCTIDLGDTLRELDTDCNGVVTSGRGSFTVTAEKRIVGRLTGDPTSPVIPTSDNAVTIEIIEATFDNFRVESSISPNIMTIEWGAISGTVSPRIAVDTVNGVCAFPTPIARFDDMRYSQTSVAVETPALNFGAIVDGSDLWAQNGPNGGLENAIGGTITMWGADREVPSDSDGLDPDYDPVFFDSSYICDDNLAYPVNFECDLTTLVGTGAGSLTIQTLAALAQIINDNESCGLTSAAAQSSVVFDGEIGKDGGTATTSVTGCVLNYPEPTVISTDCDGTQTYAHGYAVVDASLAIEGLLTGDPVTPAIPMRTDPATLNISAQLKNFKVWTSKASQALIATGGLSGTLLPRTAIDVSLGACALTTPRVVFENVTWTNGDLVVETEGKSIGVEVSTSNLHAVNGRVNSRENVLGGTISVDGEHLEIFNKPLDPAYDPVAFDAAYQCDANIQIPLDDNDCDFTPVLAQNVSRLLIQNFGNIVMAIDVDKDCGFASVANIIPGAIGTSVGEQITAIWDVPSCSIGEPHGSFLLKTDCEGLETYWHGRATISASKEASGDLAAGYPPIHPRSRTDARFDVFQVQLQEFSIIEYKPGSNEPMPHLVIHTGIFSGKGFPVTGEAKSDPGAYYIPTPITGFEDVRIRYAEVTLHNGPMKFSLTLQDSNLDAFNGSYAGKTNELVGSLTMDQRTYSIPIKPEEAMLNPGYTQKYFNDSYACEDNLKALVPWN